ncbi:MAG: DUF5672 family protein [bacterium]
MNARREAVVVLVAYKPELSPLERISVDRCLEVLQRHPIVVVAPEGLALPSPLDRLPVERFAPSFFTGIAAYSSLLLSRDFYRRFIAFRYMLIHQLDVFVFKDELSEWCARGYDYIGAPWIGEDWPNKVETRQGLPFWIRSRLFRFLKPLDHRVGNGGFSLRRVDTMIQALTVLRRTRRAWGGRNEDGFWSVAVPECWWWRYRVPQVNEAMEFAFETNPSTLFEQTGKRLPFGCHAWERCNPEFWHPHFVAAGHPFDLAQVQAMVRRERPSERHKKGSRSCR